MEARAPETTPFPADAVAWLAGDPSTEAGRTVVAVGDPEPDPQLVEALTALGHDVRASDGSFTLPADAVDVVVSVHRPPADLDEVARVLRPGGRLALVVPSRDTRIPWARKLDRALGIAAADGAAAFEQVAGPVVAHGGFGFVEETSVRFWQQVDRPTLLGLAARFPEVASLEGEERERRLEAAGALYDDYGRGIDGMQLPWVARCYRATLRADRPQPDQPAPPEPGEERPAGEAPDASRGDARDARDPASPGRDLAADTEMLLIDFR